MLVPPCARDRRAVSLERLWANSDRGLKTRGEAEVVAAPRNLVSAARAVREQTV